MDINESLKQLKENADPKLKKSQLFDFFSKFSTEEEKNTTATFDELYSSNETKFQKIDQSNELQIESQKIESEKLKLKKEIFDKFETYDFEKDKKYQDLLEFTMKQGTFDNMNEETEIKGKLKLKSKYFKKNFDKNGIFSIEEYLESKKVTDSIQNVEEEIDASTPYSESYIDIINKLQNGESLDVKIVDDKPKTLVPKLSKSKLKKKVKPWEKVKKQIEVKESTNENETEEDLENKE